MKLKKEHVLLTCIILLGLIARIVKFEDPVMVMDTVAFSRLGKNLIEYGRYVFGENYNMGIFFPPLYPFFIGIANLTFNDLFFSAKLVSLIASFFAVILSYFIGKELYNKDAGLFAALVYALYPVILIISVDAFSDSLFFCLLLLSIYIFIHSIKRDSIYCHVLLGIVMSAAFLTRPEGLFLWFLPVLQVFGIFSKKTQFDNKYLLKTVLSVLIFIMIISPYMMFIKDYTGKFSISGKANVSIILGELSADNEYHVIVNAPDNLYDRAAFALNDDKTQLRGWNRKSNLSLKEYLFSDPFFTLEKYLKNVMRQLITLIKLLIPIIIPLGFSFFNREMFRNRLRLIFILYPVFYFMLYPLFLVIEKQTLLIVVFLIFFSSGGFANAETVVSEILDYYGIRKNGWPRLFERRIKYIIVIVLLLSSLSYLKYSRFDNATRPIEHEKAGNYLNEVLSHRYEELNIMARKPYVNYYSASRFTMMPYADIADVIGFAKLYDVDYIVVDERALSRWDNYNELLELQKYSDDVELFYEDTSSPLIRLFKINK